MALTLQDAKVIEILKEGECARKCNFTTFNLESGECVHPFDSRQVRLLYRFIKSSFTTDHGTFPYSLWDIPVSVLIAVSDQLLDKELALLATAAYGATIRYHVSPEYANDLDGGHKIEMLEFICRRYVEQYEEVKDELRLREDDLDTVDA